MFMLNRRSLALLLALWFALTNISLLFAFDYFHIDVSKFKNVLPQLPSLPNNPFASFQPNNGGPLPVTQEEVFVVLRNGTNALEAERVPYILRAALDPEDGTFRRLPCSQPDQSRYGYLASATFNNSGYEHERPHYIFALDLHQATPILPRLLSSIVEAVRFLGPSSCALSVVEGRSEDGTFEALTLLRKPLEQLGLRTYYFFNTSDLDPSRDAWTQRIQTLAYLRNLVLQPLTEHPERFSSETEVIFLNDVALCSTDILELIHQKRFQAATMTCGVDWDLDRNSFYDVWIARGMSGDSFFHIPESGSWRESSNLFWNDEASKGRFKAGVPFQVFSCWNGGIVFDARVLLAENGREGIRFRAHKENECYQGEPQLFCKDLWYQGYGKIAVVPSVNFGYSDSDAKKIKKKKGTVEHWAAKESTASMPLTIEWKKDPPAEVKCIDNWEHQFWRPWNEGLGD